MPDNLLLQNCRIVNEGEIKEGDLRVQKGRIATIAAAGGLSPRPGEERVDAAGRWLFPGLIDDQVHFREPGLTRKADIFTESRAAVAGGVSSYMEMPNVIPPTLTMPLLEEKRAIAASRSAANYAFYLGASNGNADAIAAADPTRIAGVKIFMGASTGEMLVDDPKTLERVFNVAPTLIAVHCESMPRINAALRAARDKLGEDIPPAMHAQIRDADACYESSAAAVALAKKTGARLHVLHITSAKELPLFAAGAAAKKQITAEACAHHLLFDDSDYATLGMRLKCNPAVKTAADRAALCRAVAAGRIDVLATDHAPHLPAEKDLPYERAAAGLPLAEFALPAYLELVAEKALSMPDVARAAAHNVADIFAVQDRGHIREGYFADLTLAEKSPAGAAPPPGAKILSKCGWTPFAARRFRHRVWKTFVNGNCVFSAGELIPAPPGMALSFARG